MYKILITILLFTIFPLITNAADTLEVKLSGRLDTQFSAIGESNDHRNTNPYSPSSGYVADAFGFANDTRIDIKADAKSDKGFIYGASIRLLADTSASVSGETHLGDKTMFYIQSDKIGKLEIGNIAGATALMEMDIDNFGVGTYGINGYWGTWLTDKSYMWGVATGGTSTKSVQSSQFITYPVLPSNYSGNGYSDAPKINFFTKPKENITIGFTYIPDLDSVGTIKGLSAYNDVLPSDTRGNPATFRNIFGFTSMIENHVGPYKIKLNFSGEYGTAKIQSLNNLMAFEVGTMIFYKDYKVAATYGNWFNSLTYQTNTNSGRQVEADYFTLGVGQEIGNFGYSITYMNSRRAGGLEAAATSSYVSLLPNLTDTAINKFQNGVVDVDYKIIDGFKIYGAYSRFKLIESNGNVDDGNLLMLGTRILF